MPRKFRSVHTVLAVAATLVLHVVSAAMAGETLSGGADRQQKAASDPAASGDKPILDDFVRTNVEYFRLHGLLATGPAFAHSDLANSVLRKAIPLLHELDSFEIEMLPEQAEPNVYFVVYENIEEIGPALQKLGVDEDRATIDGLITSDVGAPACLMVSHGSSGGNLMGEVVISANKSSDGRAPEKCFVDSVLSLSGLSSSLEHYIHGRDLEWVRSIEVNYINEVAGCRGSYAKLDEIASCVLRRYNLDDRIEL